MLSVPDKQRSSDVSILQTTKTKAPTRSIALFIRGTGKPAAATTSSESGATQLAGSFFRVSTCKTRTTSLKKIDGIHIFSEAFFKFVIHHPHFNVTQLVQYSAST